MLKAGGVFAAWNVGTWSATRAGLRKDPLLLERARESLEPMWGAGVRTVTMPIVMMVGRHAA